MLFQQLEGIALRVRLMHDKLRVRADFKEVVVAYLKVVSRQ